jgi:hypothetical protein
MRRVKKTVSRTAALFLLSMVLFAGGTSAQEKESTKLPKRILIQAVARGQSTQLGRLFNVNVYINELSTAEDRTFLLQAFNAKGNEGLVNALSKMKSKGRIAITGTLGYDVNYIRKFEKPDGTTVIRLVTDRPIQFGEAWADSRSSDYNLSGLEIVLSKDRKKNTGTLLPACQFKIDKENQLQIEAFQNPWSLTNIMRR